MTCLLIHSNECDGFSSVHCESRAACHSLSSNTETNDERKVFEEFTRGVTATPTIDETNQLVVSPSGRTSGVVAQRFSLHGFKAHAQSANAAAAASSLSTENAPLNKRTLFVEKNNNNVRPRRCFQTRLSGKTAAAC